MSTPMEEVEVSQEPVRVGVYARVNPSDQSAGIASQVEMCRKLAEQVGEVRIFADESTSSRYKKNTAFASLVAAVENGEVDSIFTTGLDRLTRQPSELRSLLDSAEARGVDINIVQKDKVTVTLSPDDKFRIRIMASVAEYESAGRSERISAGIRASRARKVAEGQ